MERMLAHETWFTDARPAFDWAFAWQPATLVGVTLAIAVACAWRVVGHRLPRPELPFRVSLLAQAARHTYLAPALVLPSSPVGIGLTICEGILGVWLISGVHVRIAAIAVVAAGPLGMLQYGVVPILERMDLLGIALFLVVLQPGPDRFGAASTEPARVARATFSLRALVGGALIVLAFTEKLI